MTYLMVNIFPYGVRFIFAGIECILSFKPVSAVKELYY